MAKLPTMDYDREEQIGEFSIEGWGNPFPIYNIGLINRLFDNYLFIDVHEMNTPKVARRRKLSRNTKGFYFSYEGKRVYLDKVKWFDDVEIVNEIPRKLDNSIQVYKKDIVDTLTMAIKGNKDSCDSKEFMERLNQQYNSYYKNEGIMIIKEYQNIANDIIKEYKS